MKGKFMQNELYETIIKPAIAKNAIQRELIDYVRNHYDDFESMWFENLVEDFVSNYAIAHNVSFVFDDYLNVEIVEM